MTALELQLHVQLFYNFGSHKIVVKTQAADIDNYLENYSFLIKVLRKHSKG